MSLGSEVRAFLPDARAAAETLMTDTAEVYGLPTETWDETTDTYGSTASLLYTGPCRFKLQDLQVHPINAQGQSLIVQSATVSFPVAADTVFAKDFTITLIASATDPALVGKKVRINGPHAQTYATARRYPVEEVS